MINITIEYDWDAAKEDVTDAVLNPIIGSTLRYKNESPAAAIAYLSTQYFDANMVRYNQLDTYAVQTPEKVYDFMRKLMTVWLAQKEVYDEITANDAFEQFKVGNHDT